MTIREILAQASAELTSANSDASLANTETPYLDASLLLAHVLKVDRSKLLSMNTEQVSEENAAAFRSMLNRRLNGECTAYITGKKEFWGLEFFVNNSVLVPRPETEILVEAAIAIINEQLSMSNGQEKGNTKICLLDLCTGSGAIAIALKHEIPQLEVFASDISQEALEIAERNASLLLLDNNSIYFFHGDLYKALFHIADMTAPCSLFTLIVSNPPYIPSDEVQTLPAEVQKEPRLALDGGKTGLAVIERIINEAPEYLQCGGSLLLEADPRQMEEIAHLLENRGFKDIQLFKDLAGFNRVIGGVFD